MVCTSIFMVQIIDVYRHLSRVRERVYYHLETKIILKSFHFQKIIRESRTKLLTIQDELLVSQKIF